MHSDDKSNDSCSTLKLWGLQLAVPTSHVHYPAHQPINMFPAVARTGLRSAGASMRPMAFRAERQVLARQTRLYSADRTGDRADSKSKLVSGFICVVLRVGRDGLRTAELVCRFGNADVSYFLRSSDSVSVVSHISKGLDSQHQWILRPQLAPDIPVELYPMLIVVVAACVGGTFALARQCTSHPLILMHSNSSASLTPRPQSTRTPPT